MESLVFIPEIKDWYDNRIEVATLNLAYQTNFFRFSLCMQTDIVYSVTPEITQIYDNMIFPYFENFYKVIATNRRIYDVIYHYMTDFVHELDSESQNKVVDRLTKQIDALIEVQIVRPVTDRILTYTSLYLLVYQLSQLVCSAFPRVKTLHTRVIIRDDKNTIVKENEFWFQDRKIQIKKAYETSKNLEGIFLQHMLLTYIHKFFASGELPQCLHQSLPKQFTREEILNEWYFTPMKSLPIVQSDNVPTAPAGILLSQPTCNLSALA